MHFADNALVHVEGSNCCHERVNVRPATLHECCERCVSNESCDGWIWQPSSEKCWLVAGTGEALVPFPTTDKVSGVIPRNRGRAQRAEFRAPSSVPANGVLLRDRFEFPALLNSQQPSGLGIILGVGNGTFALELLEKWPGGGLYLIDPYIHLYKGYDDAENLSDVDHQIVYENLRNVLHKRGFDFRHTFVRDFSYSFGGVWVRKSLPQPTFVYIDNNHSFLAVSKDLQVWWDILAPGGLMAGSWYIGESKRAVDEFFMKKGIHNALYFTEGAPHPNWLIFKQAANDIYQKLEI